MQTRMTINELEVAAKLAHEDANVQARFFGTFCSELTKCCETHFKKNLQLAFIRREGSEEVREMFESLAYKEESNAEHA